MKALVLAVVLFTCGSKGPKLRTEFVADAAFAGMIKGTVVADGIKAAGATIIITVVKPKLELAAITDENGEFIIKQALPAGRYKLTLFYVDEKFEREVEVFADRATIVYVTGLVTPPEI